MKPEFNKEFYINQLKREVGLSDIAYEDLDKYKVDDINPTGNYTSNWITAKEYVDRELVGIESAYNTFNKEEDDNPVNPSIQPLAINPVQLEEVVAPDKLDNYKYLDVTGDGNNFTVVIYDDGKNPELHGQYQYVTAHHTFVGERSRNMLTGFETLISYYQFANNLANIRKPSSPELYDRIQEDMETFFEGGLKLEGFD